MSRSPVDSSVEYRVSSAEHRGENIRNLLLVPRSSHLAPQRSALAFTLIEVLVVITVLVVLASLVLPLTQNNDKLRLQAAARILISDLEFAQVLSISHPDVPIAVRFDPDVNQYWLAPADDPDEPITRSSTHEPYIVQLGEGRAAAADGVYLHLTNVQQNTLWYNSYGGLENVGGTPRIELSMSDTPGAAQNIVIRITPMTGMIKESLVGP